MALGRRVCKSRRVVLIGADEDGDVISDPALHEDTNAQEYYDSLFDPKHLKMQPGEVPTWWTIAPLTKRQKDAGSEMTTVRGRVEWYVRCGLLAHEHWTIEDDSGAIRNAPQPDRKTRGRVGELASEQWYEDMDLTAGIATALYVMIAKMSEAQRPLSRHSAPQSGPESSSAKASTTPLSTTPADAKTATTSPADAQGAVA